MPEFAKLSRTNIINFIENNVEELNALEAKINDVDDLGEILSEDSFNEGNNLTYGEKPK